jgi:hypothetical protein
MEISWRSVIVWFPLRKSAWSAGALPKIQDCTAIEELLDKAIHQDSQARNSLEIIRELGGQKKSGRLLSDEEYE